MFHRGRLRLVSRRPAPHFQEINLTSTFSNLGCGAATSARSGSRWDILFVVKNKMKNHQLHVHGTQAPSSQKQQESLLSALPFDKTDGLHSHSPNSRTGELNLRRFQQLRHTQAAYQFPHRRSFQELLPPSDSRCAIWLCGTARGKNGCAGQHEKARRSLRQNLRRCSIPAET